MSRCLRTLVLLGAACSIGATASYAECVRFGPSQMNSPGAAAVFDGTVLEVRERATGYAQAAVVQVHRVFKGQLAGRLEVYNGARPGFEEIRPLQAGQRYVMLISRQPPSDHGTRDRSLRPEDDPSLVWATGRCAFELRDTLNHDGTLDGFGPGWPPKG